MRSSPVRWAPSAARCRSTDKGGGAAGVRPKATHTGRGQFFDGLLEISPIRLTGNDGRAAGRQSGIAFKRQFRLLQP